MHRIHVVSIAIAVSSVIYSCPKPDPIPDRGFNTAIKCEPAIAPVTDQQAVEECNKLNQEQWDHDIENMISSAFERYCHEPFFLTYAVAQAITYTDDSTNSGLYGWRTCAKFGPVQLNLPADTIATFYDQNGEPCEKNPNGYITQIRIITPKEIGWQTIWPFYETERMIVEVVGVIKISDTTFTRVR